MAASGESAAERVWRQVAADPRRALEAGLSPADLRTLLLAVTRRRAAAVSPARLMSRWQQDRYVRLASSDPRKVYRQRARGYYERGAVRVDTKAGTAENTDETEVGDGGFTNWTAQLLGDAKERCFISCVSTERLAALVAPA